MSEHLPIDGVEIDNLEHYEEGRAEVTAVEWGYRDGHLTIKVFKNDQLHSEHPFAQVKGVYYKPNTQQLAKLEGD